MEHIWKEATGELEDEISIPLQSIKLEQDEIIPSDQQIMLQLISDEDVDFLSFIGWEGDEHERDEEELSSMNNYFT